MTTISSFIPFNFTVLTSGLSLYQAFPDFFPVSGHLLEFYVKYNVVSAQMRVFRGASTTEIFRIGYALSQFSEMDISTC